MGVVMDALEGVHVLDLTWGLAGPAGVLLLAEHGADVIKVEPPGGDPFRDFPGSRVWNRSRRSIALDLKSEEGRARLLELAASADVLAESFAPGVMARLGLDYDSLAQQFPALIYLSIPAYPSESRHAGRAGWDALVQARSGQQYEQPAWRPGPTFLASPIPSWAAAYLGAVGTLAALHARRGTGHGQRVETSLYQGVMAVTSMLWVHAERDQNRLQSMMTKTYPPTIHQPEVLRCANGWIQSVPSTQKRGVTINELFGIPADSPREELWDRLAEVYRDWKRDDLVARLHEDLFQAAPILPTRDALRHPQVVANGMTVAVDDPEVGATIQVGMPCKLTRTPARAPRPRPAVGEHNDAVGAEWTRHEVAGPGAGEPPRFPLDGIRVLDFGRAFAGPYAPMVLAGLGADVIKVASAANNPMAAMLGSSSVWLGCEQGKRSILVDMKTPEGNEVVRRLVAQSDVVHHNMTKGVAGRLGIDHASLEAIKPDIISCNTYMYGPTGPLSDLGGQDSLAQALVGWEWEAGAADAGGVPLWYRFGHGDTSNALASVVGVLLALAHRDRTGEGQAVWTSLINGAIYTCSDVYLTEDGAADPPRLNLSQTGFTPLYRLYDTQEGWIQIAGVKESHWPALCRAVGRADLEHDERFATASDRQLRRDELERILEGVFAMQTAVQWRRALEDAGVPSEISVNTLDGESALFDDENLRLGVVAETEHRDLGRLRQVGRLIRFSDTPSTVFRAPPVAGQHTVEIMQWLGYDDATIGEYKDRGIIDSA
jgi:crotonobetainyl-CoA:carnitine CoA-transferase CaiB-like acyl-CoA transferase